MGLSFLVAAEARGVAVTVRWGDYEQTQIEGKEGKPVSVWQRHPREAVVPVPLAGAGDPVAHEVPDSGGLQLHVVERPIGAADLDGWIPPGTRPAPVFLVNHRAPLAPEQGEPDLAYAFQPEIEVRCERPARVSLGGRLLHVLFSAEC